VLLSIFDATGRECARIDYGRVEAGRHEILWNGLSRDGRSLPGGAYFARLTALGASRGTRFLLVR
jgi:flagellar hook assembly protein FlgD